MNLHGATMDLFAWADTHAMVTRNCDPARDITVPKRRRATPKPRACRECGTPISAYSRGRCEPCAYSAMRKPPPDDLAIILRKLGSCGAAKHYGSSLSTVTRWRREIGLMPHERTRYRQPTFRPQMFKLAPLLVVRDYTSVGQAADFLRKFGPVSRCEADGQYPKRGNGTCWNRNGYILSDDELMAKARRLGWKPVRI